jgi:hypothetical protein
MDMKREELNLKRMELDMKREEMQMDADIARQNADIDAQAMANKSALNERAAELQAEGIEHKHSVGMEMMDHKAKMAKQKPKAEARK